MTLRRPQGRKAEAGARPRETVAEAEPRQEIIIIIIIIRIIIRIISLFKKHKITEKRMRKNCLETALIRATITLAPIEPQNTLTWSCKYH